MLTGAETPAQTASSWDGRWLLNPCWLSEITEVKTFDRVWMFAQEAALHHCGKIPIAKKSCETKVKICLVFLSSWTDFYETVSHPSYLLPLDLAAEVWDLDLHGVELFIWDLGDGKWLGLLGALEGQLSQWDVPLTIILLVFTAVGGGEAKTGGMDGENSVNKKWVNCVKTSTR